MARVCEVCGKGSIKGSIILRRGKPKRQGGVGQHVTAVTPRRFAPNIQKVHAFVEGSTKSMNVCTSCIKAGKVTKAPYVARVKVETA